jgi:pimeloyl-ACP methyl ester carboxylesterase
MIKPADNASVPLFFRDLGGADEPPIVLLHGMLGSSRNWQTAGRELAESRHVYALDLRNHGLSPHSDTMSYEAMAGDVAAWMDSQGLSEAELVGHSMGGKVAMILACRQPERVAALVVVDIAPKDYVWPAHRQEYAAMNALDLSKLASRAEAEAQMEALVPDWAMRKFLTTNLERETGGGWQWVVNLPVLTASLDVLESNPIAKEDIFAGRTLFIRGGKSRYIQPGDDRLIQAHFPKARIETIESSGHNPHIEAREAFVAAVSAFG